MYAVHHLLSDICRKNKGREREQEKSLMIKITDSSLVMDGRILVG
jgi:uncharacterized protein YacL